SVFVNVFGGITACDEVAKGIVQAFRILESEGIEPKPLVVRLDGNNAKRGRSILEELNLPKLRQVETRNEAAGPAVKLPDSPLTHREGTRLNSSNVWISFPLFTLKKNSR